MRSRKSDYCIWACLYWWWCNSIRKSITGANISFILICKEKTSSLYFKKYCKKAAFKFVDYILIIYLTNIITFANQSLINLHHTLTHICIKWVSRTSKVRKTLNTWLDLNILSICGWAWTCCLTWLYYIWLCWLRYNWFHWLKLNRVCISWLCWWCLIILFSLST